MYFQYVLELHDKILLRTFFLKKLNINNSLKNVTSSLDGGDSGENGNKSGKRK